MEKRSCPRTEVRSSSDRQGPVDARQRPPDRCGRPTIRVRTAEGAPIVEVRDAEVLFAGDDIAELAGQLQRLVEAGHTRLVLDFSGVRSMSSDVLGMLVELHRRLETVGGRLRPHPARPGHPGDAADLPARPLSRGRARRGRPRLAGEDRLIRRGGRGRRLRRRPVGRGALARAVRPADPLVEVRRSNGRSTTGPGPPSPARRPPEHAARQPGQPCVQGRISSASSRPEQSGATTVNPPASISAIPHTPAVELAFCVVVPGWSAA